MATLVLLPGLACDDELWRDIVPALAPAHEVVISDVHARHDSLPAMAAALLAEHDGPLRLAGCSMGGMVALEAAHQAPARIGALALLGSTARPDTPELITLRTQACELYAAGRMEEVLRANVAFAFHPDHASDGAMVERYLAMIRRAGADALIRQNRAVMARADARPLLAATRCPTLVVCGDADLLTPPEHAREMAALLPHARLAIVEHAGHLLSFEQPAALAALLTDWLAGLDAPRQARR